MAARGKFKEKSWRRSSGDPATIDDITVIVIPILPYKQEVCHQGSQVNNPPDSPEEEVELEVHFEEKKIVRNEEPDVGTENLEIVLNNGESVNSDNTEP